MRDRLALLLASARVRARIAVFVTVFIAANVTGMSAAFGDSEGNSGASSVWRWMDVTDSEGNSAWGYSMSLDYGGITDVGNAVFGGVTGLCWFFYQWFVIASIWLINFALSMDWFEPLKAPAQSIAHNLEALLGQFGLEPLVMAITAVAACWFVLAGRWATAVFEVLVTLIILSLGTGVFANPVDQTVGNSSTAAGSGWLGEANTVGLELAGGLQKAQFVGHTSDISGFSDPDAVRQDISGQLVDTFLRTPHQLINYGKVLDGTTCEDAYNDSLSIGAPSVPDYVSGTPGKVGDSYTIDTAQIPDEGGPGWDEWDKFRDWITNGDEDALANLNAMIDEADGRKLMLSGAVTAPETGQEIDQNGEFEVDEREPREIVSDCDGAAGDRAESPSPGMAGDAATMGFGVIFLVGLAVALAGGLIFLGVEFLWCALRSIWDFIIGLLPGRSRTSLWRTLATAIWCLIGVGFTSVFLVSYLLLITSVATDVGQENIMGAFVLVDILMLIGLILFWRVRARMRRAAEATAHLLSRRPGKQPVKMPTGGGNKTDRALQAYAGYQGAKAIGSMSGKALGVPRRVATNKHVRALGKKGGLGAIGVAGGAAATSRGVVAKTRGALGGVVRRVFGRNTQDRTRGSRSPSAEQVWQGYTDRANANGDGRPARPHGSAQVLANLRGLRAKSGSAHNPATARRHPPGGSGSRPRPATRRSTELAGRLAGNARVRATPTRHPGPSRQPRRRYRRIVKDGQTLHVPEE